MGRRAIPPEALAKLLEHFRANPPTDARSFGEAAKASGLHKATCRRAWERGWPSVRALRDVIADEQLKTRYALAEAELKKLRESVPHLVNELAVEQSLDEARSSLLARRNAIQLQAFASSLSKSARVLSDSVAAMVAGGTLTPDQIRQLCRDFAFIVKTANETAYTAIEIERLRVGDPTTIIGIKPVEAERSIEDIERDMELLRRAVQRRKVIEVEAGIVDEEDG